jgi:hypothetical protein
VLVGGLVGIHWDSAEGKSFLVRRANRSGVSLAI